MKVLLISADKVRLIPTGGRIRDRYTDRTYSEVITTPMLVRRYEDADSVVFETVDATVLPEEIREVFDKVVGLIATAAANHDALDDLKSMPNVNIANLFQLAADKGVTEAELQQIIIQVVMLKTDIEAKLPRSWYDVWNGNLKPYIVTALANMG